MTTPNLFPCPCGCGCGYLVTDGGLCAYCKRGEHDGAPPDRPAQEERPDPPDGELLFRFKPPELTKRQRGMTDVCVEYAVTALTDEEIASSVMLVPHNGVIIWGWLGWKNDWEANISARPVVFELLKQWRTHCRILAGMLEEQGASLGSVSEAAAMRLPAYPKNRPTCG